MTQSPRARCTLLAVLALAVAIGATLSAQKRDDKKPSLSLKVTPLAGFSPLRVRVAVEVKGGANDSQDFYCPSVEWDWGDDLNSGNSEDCAPYEAGRSEIKRRYSGEHVYRQSGNYRLNLRLKQKDRIIATASAMVEVRPGLQDGFDN
jgi:hypothetical protein